MLPIIYSYIAEFLNSTDTEIIKRYKSFIEDFMSSGSFLWISITVLSGSFSDLLLYGLKKKLSGCKKLFAKVFICVLAILGIYAMIVYFGNILIPLDKPKMKYLSVALFVIFAVASGFISLKIVQEE